MNSSLTTVQVALLTVLAMLAFAANSVLARLALGLGTIDAASFTLVRLASGALMLWLLVGWQSRRGGNGDAPRTRQSSGNWPSAAMLFIYAICFSVAYLMLSTATGALILFGSVQLTMVAWALREGERPRLLQWLGWALALAGLVYLMLPGVTAPAPIGALLMAMAGIAWGVYSLRGRGARNPSRVTADNFLRTVPMAVVAALVAIPWFHLSFEGIGLALLSGVIASGLGYTLWYSVLPSISATQAATCQLSVPVIAAIAGVVLVAEPVSLRLVLAATTILGGIGLSIWSKTYRAGLA